MTQKRQTVVIVDDEPSMRDYLTEVLAETGYRCECFDEGIRALAFISECSDPVDLVLTDISMPGMGGLDLLRTSSTLYPDLPVVMISGMCDMALAIEALKGGATDYLLKPATPNDVIAIVKKNLDGELEGSHAEVRQALNRFLGARSKGDTVLGDLLRQLFDVIGFKRHETLQHSRRVAEYARCLGKACELSGAELTTLQLGALLHDIGKVAIPSNVLLKPGPLDPDERTIMQLHPRVGWELLADFKDLQVEAEVVYSHHERFDGKGYPRGLKGTGIAGPARVFSVVDTLDAITSHRPYRRARSFATAREIIVENSGTQFDPAIVEELRKIPTSTLVDIRQQFPDLPGDDPHGHLEGGEIA